MKYDKNDDHWGEIDTHIYDWSIKVFRALKNMLRVNMQLDASALIQQGDIFLFNHFSRFETFIPQYMIYEKTGDYCCSIASSEFFHGDSVLTSYLKSVGVLPHDHDRLFAILAGEILKGRKVIIFPEGGMVKDRRVLDKNGRYSIYSRITGERRKQHTGPAVLAQGLETFKSSIRNAYKLKDTRQLKLWMNEFEIDSLEKLLLAALKPTLIIPANITFYPIRSTENILHQGVQMLSSGLTLRQTEELLIEGNIIFKHTDMNIRLGSPIAPFHVWHWWNQWLLKYGSTDFKNLDEVFAFHQRPKGWRNRVLNYYFQKNAAISRDLYMKEMYENVTINLCHLASTLIMHLMDEGQDKIEKQSFYRFLYVSIKFLQKNEAIHLHSSLFNPDDYRTLLQGVGKRFEQFIQAAESSGLIVCDKNTYFFTPKLQEDYGFDEIRMENPIAVYNNEARPISAVLDAVKNSCKRYHKLGCDEYMEWYLEDERLSLLHDKKRYSDARYDAINQHETAHEDANTFFLSPETPNGFGILLIHGLLASPYELKAYGEYLVKFGYAVLGVRLKGHGTSPHDLRDCSREDWYASLKRGFDFLGLCCDQCFVIGFSTGGALALKLACEYAQKIAGVIAVSVPMELTPASLTMIPILQSNPQILKWLSYLDKIKPFIENTPEHPNINYRCIPIKSLYELRLLIEEIEVSLHEVNSQALIIQADNDPIISKESAQIILSRLKADKRSGVTIPSNRHGILMENTGDIWRIIDLFLNQQMHSSDQPGSEDASSAVQRKFLYGE